MGSVDEGSGVRFAWRRMSVGVLVAVAAGLFFAVSGIAATPKPGGTATAGESNVPAILGSKGQQNTDDRRPHSAYGGLLRVPWAAVCPRSPSSPQIADIVTSITDQFGGTPVISGVADPSRKAAGGTSFFTTSDSGTFENFVFMRVGLTKETFHEKVVMYCNNNPKITLGDLTFNVGGKKPPLGVDWQMATRLDTAHADWGGDAGLPPASYVSPKEWEVFLFLTSNGERVCPAGVTFDWTVSGVGYSKAMFSHACSGYALVPKLGTYSVTAKELKDGKATGTEATNTHVVVRDWLIVGLGDSNGSGQGNPPYINARCDRSVASYQYQTALYVETHDPHTSVTFVFDSCSGSRSDQVWQNPYEGQEPSGGVMLPPQIDQVKGVIGDRKPDAVIMSAGINDLYFGSTMAFCAFYFPSPGNPKTGSQPDPPACQDAHVSPTKDALGYTTEYSYSRDTTEATVAVRTAERLAVLPGRLALLNQHLASLGAAHVFATQYPDETTDQNGHICNNTGPRPRLSVAVWSWLQQTGNSLNSVVAGTASDGWIPITGVAAGFIGHGFCSTDSYFVTPAQSVWRQSNGNGSFHATASGAAITYALTRDKVCEALYGNPTCDGEAPASK